MRYVGQIESSVLEPFDKREYAILHRPLSNYVPVHALKNTRRQDAAQIIRIGSLFLRL